MSTKVRVAATADLPPGSAIEVTVGDKIIALYNVDGDLYGLDGLCAHQGGPIGSGDLKGSVVTCPWHGWQYDVTTGENCLNSHIRQEQYVVEAEGDDLFVYLKD